MINKIIKSGGPRYLFDELRFGQSSRLFNLLIPALSLNARSLFVFQQIIETFGFFKYLIDFKRVSCLALALKIISNSKQLDHI
jgi:hypothetical protein